MSFYPARLQRLKSHPYMRDLCSETDFNQRQLIQPLFVVDSINEKEEIPGLKDNYRHSRESLLKQLELDLEAGVRHFILFGVPAAKTDSRFNFEFTAQTIREIKKRFSDELVLWVDNCLCSYTTSGHCCTFAPNGQIDLESTLQSLARSALEFTAAGADGISPSDMMDGRTQRLRQKLDENGFQQTPIMSYSTKFASHFYGPFRNAANSSPQFGDRRQYQLDVRDKSTALAASMRCASEGADLLMVKPGMTSIDLIRPIAESTQLKVGAYQVSGEYASLVLLAKEGLIDFDKALKETWQVFKRAGAQYIISYGARRAQISGLDERGSVS